ncbi:hypothetical protein FPSE_11262, partial [Fusarium pseudograminearum CS3096]
GILLTLNIIPFIIDILANRGIVILKVRYYKIESKNKIIILNLILISKSLSLLKSLKAPLNTKGL